MTPRTTEQLKADIGKTFNRLTVLEELPRGTNYRRRYKCECSCGNMVHAYMTDVRSGHTKSCGCLSIEVQAKPKSHGGTYSPEYRVWSGIKNRCYNPKESNYKWYGAKGITMSDEWKNSFAAFIRDMGKRPSPKHQIDRRDFRGHYCKENCRWLLPVGQARNRSTNRLITFHGATRCLQEWSEVTGIKPLTIRYRLEQGWPIEKALTSPIPA